MSFVPFARAFFGMFVYWSDSRVFQFVSLIWELNSSSLLSWNSLLQAYICTKYKCHFIWKHDYMFFMIVIFKFKDILITIIWRSVTIFLIEFTLKFFTCVYHLMNSDIFGAYNIEIYILYSFTNNIFVGKHTILS